MQLTRQLDIVLFAQDNISVLAEFGLVKVGYHLARLGQADKLRPIDTGWIG